MLANLRIATIGLRLLACAAMVAAAPVAGAHAQILAVATAEGTYTQPVNSETWQAIFVSVGKQFLTFNTKTTDERILITYTSTCFALDFTVLIRANVDGVIASPGVTNGVPLCSTALTGSTYPATLAFSAVIPTPGTHKATLEVKTSGNGAAIAIGNSLLAVQR